MEEFTKLALVTMASTTITIATTAVLGWLIWLCTLKYKTYLLNKLLHDSKRRFYLHYRGESEPEKKKKIIFDSNGTISGEEKNKNECFWKIRYGALEIYTNGNVLFSKFKWKKSNGRLEHVNDPRLPSVMGQYIIPSFIPAAANKDIYAE